MLPVNKETSPYSKIERRGSAVAHGAALLVGLPLMATILQPDLAFLPCPVIAYLISRSFRRRQKSWGASQALQASAVQLMILLLAFLAGQLSGTLETVATLLVTVALLMFLYSLWGALDTLLGYDFRYIGISNLMNRVSHSNLKRMERRRRWFGASQNDKDDEPQT